MSHASKQIRTAFKQLLDGGKNWSGVHETRIPTSRHVWPFLLVFSDSEPQIALNVQDPNIYERDLNIVTLVYVRLTTDPENSEDMMDRVAVEIEQKITSALLKAKLTSQNVRLTLDNRSSTIIVDEDDKISHAEVMINWTVKYFTQEGQPETLL